MQRARLTMTLGSIVESGTPIFTFKYPIIDEYKDDFEAKFIDHFYDSEINFHSFAMFQRRLCSKLNVIMPYYNQLYRSECMITNPLISARMTESYERDITGQEAKVGVSNATTTDNIHNREGMREDNKSKTIGNRETDATTDGTLDRDNGSTENQDTTSHETSHEDKGVTTSTDQLSLYDETNTGNKSTYFADTPQINFVIGNSNPDGSPISLFATTVTQEISKDVKTGEQNTTTDTDENTDRTVDVDGDINRVTEYTATQNDITHGESFENLDYTEDVDTNTVMSMQQQGDRKTFNATADNTLKAETNKLSSDKTREGFNNRTESQMLLHFRKTFLNIAKMILDECEILFLGVY